MAEGADYEPGCWQGHDFAQARQQYVAHAGRSYEEARGSGRTCQDLVPKTISTQCSWPLIFICDQTGSMGKWPGVIFSKAPYLELEGQEYLGKDMEISFAAIGDARNNETYPLQVRPFTKGTDIKTRLQELVIEGGGGGQTYETYELAALYFARNVAFPKAIRKPVMIFIGDESPYDRIEPDLAKRYCHVNLQESITTRAVFAELCAKYSVYLIRKTYEEGHGDRMSTTDRRIRSDWAKLIGEERISDLDVPERVVDVTFGLLALETDRVPYFRDEIKGRQTSEQVAIVSKALSTIHVVAASSSPPPKDDTSARGKSRLLGAARGKKTKSLLDD
ncbi:MAG: hypothetical protein RDU25_01060 [Patescibacteria group bacterium]|nr:hypothetical protein [Patescibacteria group bacterium]